MSIIEPISALRKRLGIKKLKKRIPVSEFEKAAIRELREHEKLRVLGRVKLHA